jgi:Ca-activated chloride channel family protein
MWITPACRLACATLVLCACLFVGGSAFQEPQAPQPRTVFSSRSELVVIHASVLDRKAGFVSGLPREAFTVYENGEPQTVSLFTNEDSAVTVGLVIDCSGSMQRKRDAVISAGLAFARSSHPQDEMFTVNFNERVWAGLPPATPFTSSLDELRNALQRSTARGQTALFDAIRTSLDHLNKGRQQKKVLIVVSDGADNASAARFEDVLDAAFRMDAVIYTIGLFDEYDREAKPGLLRKLAEATGAESFFPRNPDDATRILERIGRDIRNGYTIGYVPTAGSNVGGYRSIRVTVKAPDRRKLRVRARSGYLAKAATDGNDRR